MRIPDLPDDSSKTIPDLTEYEKKMVNSLYRAQISLVYGINYEVVVQALANTLATVAVEWSKGEDKMLNTISVGFNNHVSVCISLRLNAEEKITDAENEEPPDCE